MLRYVRARGWWKNSGAASEGWDGLVTSSFKILMNTFGMWDRHSLFGLLEDVLGPAAALLVGIPFPYPCLGCALACLVGFLLT
jgi:hypothetical protein